jgi:glycosyltransferase involved in cell wall biosynthesis
MLFDKLTTTASFQIQKAQVALARPLPARKRFQRRGVALVSWAFPPDCSSSAHFPKAIAEVASQVPVDFTVICAPAPEATTAQGLEMRSSLPASLRILRAPGAVDDKNDPVSRPVFRTMPSLDGGFDTAVSMAATAMRGFGETVPEVVLAAGPRFSNFLAARYLAKWAEAKLVLFYMDEWGVQTPPFVSASASDRKWEERCLESADAVCYVTKGKRAVYESAYPFLRTKPSHVCPNGWDATAFAKARHGTHHLQGFSGKFCISFVGSAAEHAPIGPFLAALDQVLRTRRDFQDAIRLVLVGNQPETARSQITAFSAHHPGVVHMLAAVAQSEAIEIMRESTVLLLLNTCRYDGIVPQKTYDYLNVATPILAYGATGGAAPIVTEGQAGIAVTELTRAALEDALDILIKTPKKHWDSQVRRTYAQNFNRQALAKGLLEFLLHLDDKTMSKAI